MRILMTADVVGGVWTFAQELAAGLLERDCDVCMVSFGGRASSAQQEQCDGMTGAWGDRFRYQQSEAPLEWMDANDRAYLEGAPLLLRVADEFRPDAVVSSQFCFGALPLAIPKVVVAHSDVLSWAECCRDARLEDSAWLRRYCQLVARGLKSADVVIAPTQWMLEALARNFEVSCEKVVIPNGRSIGDIESRARRMQAVTAGRLWDEAKNIAALHNVQLPLPLVIAGEASPDLPPAVNTTFFGLLAPNEVLDLFRESSIYICPSRYEPFGLAPLEAALCGCAVVANDIPSLREVWEDGAIYFCGPARLEAVLRELCESPEQLCLARMRSRERAGTYTRERMTSAYLQVLESAHARSAGEVLCRVA